jgi:hypothetical protein
VIPSGKRAKRSSAGTVLKSAVPVMSPQFHYIATVLPSFYHVQKSRNFLYFHPKSPGTLLELVFASRNAQMRATPPSRMVSL